MPKMTNRWRNAAVVMASLGFLAVVRFARFVVSDPACVPNAPNCIQHTQIPVDVFVQAAVNAALWFGIVYLVYLVVYGVRKLRR